MPKLVNIQSSNVSSPLKGEVRVPGDKSISHRSIIFGSIAEGVTRVSGFLDGEDCLATARAFKDMGVQITETGTNQLEIEGVGMHGLRAPHRTLDIGNSGTSIRLLSGLLAGQDFNSSLSGDVSLNQRPMNRIIDPLRRMGADISGSENNTAPLAIAKAISLTGIDYKLPMASAQVKSAVLLAGMYANGSTSVTEPAITRDHTERMLVSFGYDMQTLGSTFTLTGGGRLTAASIDVPADISSAAFLMVAASIVPGSDILLEHVGVNPTRTGVIDILKLMGADITLENSRMVGAEPVADIRIRSAALHGIDVPPTLVPLAIDEFPVIFVAAACATGQTRLTEAAELRVKESDRLQVMSDGLNTCGIESETTPDGIVIEGGAFSGGQVNSSHDHRIAMAFAVAGLQSAQAITIEDCANVTTSFPGFVGLANELGFELELSSS